MIHGCGFLQLEAGLDCPGCGENCFVREKSVLGDAGKGEEDVPVKTEF
jgi:hypothetical protein